ncbi:hypothetical protein FSP39_003444 [Pinctada imbricata]|uniref:Uncharacterized protein n=1 Tax=Pinctada imbricata TaxID=66713 RepID=A0AA89CBU7_PINIB|nr:hypothetical protein FSP39_003444 [Pinctada imbricata]
MVCNAKTVVLHMNLCRVLDLKDIPLVLLMETEKVSPGFTLLRCLRYNYREVGLVLIGTDMYLSSKVIRESYNPGCTSNLHGPCKTFNVYEIEYDYAYTLQCSIWPRQAMSFIYRSLLHGWPCNDVLTDICNDGCLLVPINSKQQVYSELMDLEWRISFSLAEKKLIHSMNYCQFLTYGLMKIFLNEVLKKIPDAEDLLCSYFMKTAVFWEISECSDHWSPSKFLVKFWNVFSRIMKWVSFGYCPNFFIPEHNMFFGKIYGRQQKDLMLRLRLLFDEGFLCLLRCHTLSESLSLIFQYPLLPIAMPIALHLFPFESTQPTIEEEKIKMVSASIGCFLHGDDIPH